MEGDEQVSLQRLYASMVCVEGKGGRGRKRRREINYASVHLPKGSPLLLSPMPEGYNFVFPSSTAVLTTIDLYRTLKGATDPVRPPVPVESIKVGWRPPADRQNGFGYFLFDVPKTCFDFFDCLLYRLSPKHKCFAMYPRSLPLSNVPYPTTTLKVRNTPTLDFRVHSGIRLVSSLRSAGRCCRVVHEAGVEGGERRCADHCEFLHVPSPTERVGKKSNENQSRHRRRAQQRSTPRNLSWKRSGWGGAGVDRHRNCNRAGIFRKWCEEMFGRELMESNGGVLDVAGGKGELAFELLAYGRVGNVTIVDPRPYHVYGMLQRLTMGHVQRVRGRETSTVTIGRHGIEHTSAELPLPSHAQAWFEYPLPAAAGSDAGNGMFSGTSLYVNEKLTSEADQVAYLSKKMWSCAVVIGMHPDQATEAIVDFALAQNKPFAIVPCCIFPKMFPHRKVKSGESVVSHDQFCQYLIEKDPSRVRRTILDFPGRNVCLYSLGKGNDPYVFLLRAYLAQASFQQIVRSALLALGGWDQHATQQSVLASIVNGDCAQMFPVSWSYRKLFLSSYMKMLCAQNTEDICDELAEEVVASMTEQDNSSRLSFKTYFMATGVSISVAQTSGSLGGAMETGGKVWPASLVLAEYLSAHREILVGQRVLEIGCGTGVAGIAMGKIERSGIKRLVLSDFSVQVLENMLDNVDKNGLHSVRPREYTKRLSSLPSGVDLDGDVLIEALLLDVCQVSPDDIARIASTFDVILMSDMIYDVNLCLGIMTFLSELLRCNSAITIISSTEQRGSSSHASYDQRLVALGMKRDILFSSQSNGECLKTYPWLPFVGQGLGTFNVERIARRSDAMST